MIDSIEILLAKKAVSCSKWEWREGMLSENIRVWYWFIHDEYVGIDQLTKRKCTFFPTIPNFLDAITIGKFSELIEDLVGKDSDEWKNIETILIENGCGREYLKELVSILEKKSN